MKAKHQRLLLVLVAVAALIGAAFIAANALREEASYFYTPSDLKTAEVAPGKAIRLGGMVKPGSINRSKDGTEVSFVVQDKDAAVSVRYRGITPDLFVEGSGVTADGRMGADGVFQADSLLAKHDENYVPRELADMDMEAMRKSGETLADENSPK